MDRNKNVLLISENDFYMIYQPCYECGDYADDGGLRHDKFVCHDCLDNKEITTKGYFNHAKDFSSFT